MSRGAADRSLPSQRVMDMDCDPSTVLPPSLRDELRTILGLSPQEFRILLCIMDGLTQQAIADEIGCRPSTVDSHLRRIFMKLRVSKRASAVARLFVAYTTREGKAAGGADVA